ncbi:hypothetical protein Rhow_003120 [Rhodococcus wratislaviensis]|uniref:Uncharacterized protein n=1 Tax=Rhodococcus wratislaviensis TaxID=44752 RepID=A0A402C7K2_RHOWR|nr:hypothetical protein [Rhodococcus wratislaviensis]GCE39596.1 hypothetical protein Rhow_003120 [Rhodococcus wratislaviensis]
MTALPEPFFSWTTRRIDLAGIRDSEFAGLVLDEPVPLGKNKARLIATRDDDADVDYLALIVGDVADGRDIAVRGVDEEALLIEGSRSESTPEILVGMRTAATMCDRFGERRIGSQLCLEGPVRSMIASVGVKSVVVDWCHVSSAVA